ncbi:MAG TPA: hypothetical protein VM030_11795, partial [Acidimicrobiales bacterium]|nr:hypothetical protein [Acidimicrobiales bacterium]
MTALVAGLRSTYDKRPIAATGPASAVRVGRDAAVAALAGTGAAVTVIDAYPGVRRADLAPLARATGAELVVDTADALLPSTHIDRLVAPDLGTDPVFGRITSLTMDAFFDPLWLAAVRATVARARSAGRRVVVHGVGASFVVPDGDVVVLADLPRWEAQQRQRAGETDGLGGEVTGLRPSQRYKRSFFVEWRVADAHKRAVLARADFVLDTVDGDRPVLVDGDAVRAALADAARRPFRVVPFFDPAPWGGRWMEAVCDLPPSPSNYGWCFDCVPEENSVLLGFGATSVELPALDLVHRHGVDVLGREVHERFHGEFPIRFDFLDTVGGGNLSLQVHPLESYLAETFGAGSGHGWTQHESYYVLDAVDGASVYLGLRADADVDAMFAELK